MIVLSDTMIYPRAVGLSWFLCLILAALFSIDPALAARDTGEKRECATCHIMWLKDFKRTDIKTLIPYEPRPVEVSGKQDVVSTEKMCVSCHDGFVRDSRKSWKEGRHGHPVGMKPSSKIKIPTSDNKTIFPLNDDGKVYCGTCHTAHGEQWDENDPDAASSVFMRVRNVESGICLACHLGMSTGSAEGNHPVFKKLDGALPEKLRQKGAKTGKDNTVICQTCHIAHGAENIKNHLVMNTGRDNLCATCHQDKKSVIESKHDLSKTHPEVKNIKGHTVQESGVCSACHVPHGGKGSALWAGKRLPGVDATAAACLGCHNKDGVGEKKALTKHNHPVGVAITRTGINVHKGKWQSQSPLYDPASPSVALPLYDKNGDVTDHGGNVGCGSCHDPHITSVTPSDEEVKAEKENRKTDFLRMSEDGGSALCLNCHISKRAILLSKHNPEIFQSDESLDGENSKSDNDVCTTCHQAHHSDMTSLWARDFGPGKAAIESLCTDCHFEDGIAEKKLTGDHSHPLSVSADGMSESGLPLFNKDGAKKGRNVDCATCHDLHQWDPLNPLSKAGSTMEEEGDLTNSFLRMPVVSGELCIDCHHEKGNILGTEHDLNITAAKAMNLEGKKVDESGVCGQCHLIHNASGDPYLWAREVGDDEVMNGLCNSCHADNKPGEQKQPRTSKHPKDTKIWSQKLRTRYGKKVDTELPVYDENGVTDSMGTITCSTCHDAHRWWAGKDKEGPGENTEGDVASSFLRATHTSNMVCVECHGKEALFRYKYFHSPSTHRK
jgi:predicted CXXCH cytochrome family protein